MSYDGPRTVTFNAPPQDEAQYRSAKLGSRVIGATLGVAAVILTGVALLWSLNFAVSLAATWGEVFKLGLIAVGGTLALAGLPVASALLSRSYPQEAQWAMQLWLYAMVVAAIGMAVFVLTLSPNDQPAPATQSGTVTQADIARLENRVRDDVWYYSNGCQAPQDGFQRRHCRDVIEARQGLGTGSTSADWSPRTILPLTVNASDGVGRRLLVLMLGLLAIAGAGLLGRLAVLATAETYRLAFGEAAPIPSAPVQMPPHIPPMDDAGATLTPIQIFDMWFHGRVRHDPGGKLPAAVAYEDYRETCALNSLAAISQKKFGELLTAKAEASGGRIAKVKMNGANFYSGLAFAGDRGGLHEAPIDLDAQPYREI